MKNCNKKILAQYLYDLAKESKSEFIEISKDSELIKIAEKMNLVVPSPDIAILKTIYARTDVPNRNNIVLPKEAAKKALPTLVGKQANWSHLGKNYICGWILDAKLEKDLIVTYIAIYKSLFPEEFEKMKEMVKGNKMAVSFEIWNKDENGNSVLHDLGNGIKSIDPIIYHGVGILIEGETPACKEAYAEKLLATANKKIIDEAEKITNEVFNQDLVFAALVIEEPICVNCGKCNCIKDKEENKMELVELFANVTKEEEITFELAMAFYYSSDEDKAKLTEDAAKWTKKFINGLPDSAFAAIEPAYPEKTEDKNARHLPHHNGEGDLGKEKSNANLDLPHYKNALARCNQIKPISDSISAEDLQAKASTHLERHKDALEKSSEEPKTEVKPIETQAQEIPVVAETKIEEPKVEVTLEVKTEAEVKPEEKKEEAQPLEVIEPKIIVKTTSIYSEVRIDTYIDGTPSGTQEVKGYTKTITEYKDGTKDEVETEVEIKKKFDFAEVEEKVNAAKAEKDAEIATLKAEQERILVEKDKEITIIKQELGKKDQEIAELKPPEVEVKKEMAVGTVEVKTKTDTQKQAENINAIIASKHKK
jgi:hypothetical protein